MGATGSLPCVVKCGCKHSLYRDSQERGMDTTHLLYVLSLVLSPA